MDLSKNDYMYSYELSKEAEIKKMIFVKRNLT